MTAHPKSGARLVALRIELVDVTPLVWRRVLVPDKWSFANLHKYLQWVMGWNDTHAHEFEAGKTTIAPDWWIEEMSQDQDAGNFRDERKLTVGALVAELDMRGEFEYRYDMGDDWRLRIVIEAPPANSIDDLPLPRCVAGENAGPPDDVGGPHGYQDFLRIISDRRHEQHADMLRWIGGVFDPQGFDLNRINRGWQESKGRKG
jgi:hypothetical protein